MTSPSGRVVVVTPNPALDVTYRVDRQLVGQTVRVRSVLHRAGGKGLNVARVLHTLGFAVHTVQPLGGDAGRWIAAELDRSGIGCTAVGIEGTTRSTVTVVDDVAHPTVLAEPGPELSAQDASRVVAAAVGACAPGDVLVVSGSLPRGAADLGALVAAGRAAGARVLVDVSGPALLDAARAGADLLKPNAEEAREATGAPDLDGAVDRLLALGAGRVVVSDGAAGLVSTGPAGRVRQSAVPGVTGNPTGAGDAATAGLAAGWVAGTDPATALRWAALLGAAAVLRPGAGEIDPADLPELSARLDDLHDDPSTRTETPCLPRPC
ncbi:1-phosphofructokinase family hexose kinase [Kineococcus rhizosphaerae]|uniref:Carbohydrate kinase PfkB domain-containing protein n=1 Tax=Kineococcus rhizosphaerae TaxID=559628 RepID=A0A2T0R358_9ACTN|nr:hexose kinase [Kineococcus rhizosphaerae]PRY14498.1 tagatose 6-phosphate kinase/hypothetical protein [Kineococcus rhizosphaerae]